MVAHAFNPSQWEAEEAELLWAQGERGPHSEFKAGWNSTVRPCLKKPTNQTNKNKNPKTPKYLLQTWTLHSLWKWVCYLSATVTKYVSPSTLKRGSSFRPRVWRFWSMFAQQGCLRPVGGPLSVAVGAFGRRSCLPDGTRKPRQGDNSPLTSFEGTDTVI